MNAPDKTLPMTASTNRPIAINHAVNREEQRKSFIQDAMHAWLAYQTTGEHVSHHAADEWLKALESGEDIERPKHSVGINHLSPPPHSFPKMQVIQCITFPEPEPPCPLNSASKN